MVNKFKSKKGFTLIELLVVIAIIGILAVTAVPALFKNIGKAKVADLESEYNAIKSAILIKYAEENELDRGFGSLNEIINNMENIDDITPVGGKYYIEIDKKTGNNSNDLNFSGYKLDSNGNYSEKRIPVVADFKMALLIRAEKWEGSKAINGPKITKNQFEKLARDIGYDNVYILKDDFPDKDQEIYIGIIPQ
ncbi:MAG: type II secretion system protein [Paraclostridium sp.]